MTEKKNSRGRPKLGELKKKPKNLKLSIKTHKQLEKLSKSSNKPQAIIIETLVEKATKTKKLIE